METLDYPSILNNFIYIFDFVDFFEMRSEHVSVNFLEGTLEKILRFDSKYIYPDYSSFKSINYIAMLQMQAYYDFLKDHNVYYENVIQWFFTDYLKENFGCPAMRITMPSQQSTPLEKCVNICSAMEAVIKQFTCYVKTKDIDFDFITSFSEHQKYNQIPSLIEKKYIYGKGEDYFKLDSLLFSDQCLLAYVPRIRDSGKNYRCFFNLLKSEKIYKNDYYEKDFESLEFLQKNGIISVSDLGLITLVKSHKIDLLTDLYAHDTISRWHYPLEYQKTIDEWVEQDILFEESSLLSRPESDYFSFLLNREKYSNGLEIRNGYSHGNGQMISDDNIHKQNYNILLRLMTILVIKINDEFCLYEKMQDRGESDDQYQKT